MHESDNTERRPRPDGETRIESEVIERRSVGHAALQAVESIAGDAQHTLVTLAVTGAALKIKGALGSRGSDSKSNDSKPDPGDQG
jgi:hypothetical protein